jgi:hypothetical protein
MRRTIGRAIVTLLSVALLSAPGAAAATAGPAVAVDLGGATLLGPTGPLSTSESGPATEEEGPVLTTGTPTLTGTFVVGSTVTADPGVWSEGTTFGYEWYVGDEAVPDVTSSSLVLLADFAGKPVRVDVTGTLEGHDPVTVGSADSLFVIAPGRATISGTPTAGQILTAVPEPGAWAEGTTFTYRWLANGAPIGATGRTFTLADGQIGASVAVEVTATNPVYASATVRSPAVRIAARPLTTAKPTISGTLASGYTVTAKPGAWTSGTTFSYQWLRGTTVIGTSSTLKLDGTHVGATIRVKVTGSRAGYVTATLLSDISPKVVAPGTPSVSGTAIVGNTLTAATGTWATGTTFARQWFADGVAITNATGATFKVTAAQSGKALTVRVTGSRPSYATVARTSKATPRVMRWSTPTISGTFAYGSTLTARPGTWTTGATFRYQWYSDGRAITGATYSTLKLGTAQKDKRISVRVTGSKSGHPTVAKTSAQSGKVGIASTPKISGTPVHGSTLTAKPGTWTASTKYYQWYADGVAISGATYATLKLGTAQKGKRITVKVTGKRSGYATVAKTSAATLRVATVSTPTISGSRLVTYTLTARPGTWTTGTAFTYQWYANGVALSGATYSTLSLKASQVGKRITVRVTGTKSGYPRVSRTSAATGAIAYPVWTYPVSSWSCPSWAPIKGNANSMIYHMPSGRYYSVTKPEECFRTESAAVNAGYRKSKL